MKNFFTPSEIAKLCEVSTGSVIRWIREGKLLSSVTGGGHYRVHKQQLCRFLESLQIPIPAGLSPWPEKKVLIVDDEPNIRRLIRSILKRNYPDLLIDEAEEGFVAGWKAHEFRPDLVILDLNLPGLDGFRVCGFIRSFPQLSRTKILAITGQGEERREQILKQGADDFLTKPFEDDVFLQKVGVHLNGTAPGGQESNAHSK